MQKNLKEEKSMWGKTKDALAKHFVDSTALLIPSNPLWGALETFGAGMSIDNSINARLLGAGLTYAGMGRLFTKGLDTSRKIFKIKPETKERKKQVHDTAYAVVYNLVITPTFYYAAGVKDVKQIAIGTGISLGLGAVLGGTLGYVVDGYRDLTGIENSVRIPKAVSRQSPKFKKTLAGLILAGSVALTGGVYLLKNHYANKHSQNQKIEQTNTYNLEKFLQQ